MPIIRDMDREFVINQSKRIDNTYVKNATNKKRVKVMKHAIEKYFLTCFGRGYRKPLKSSRVFISVLLSVK